MPLNILASLWGVVDVGHAQPNLRRRTMLLVAVVCLAIALINDSAVRGQTTGCPLSGGAGLFVRATVGKPVKVKWTVFCVPSGDRLSDVRFSWGDRAITHGTVTLTPAAGGNGYQDAVFTSSHTYRQPNDGTRKHPYYKVTITYSRTSATTLGRADDIRVAVRPKARYRWRP